MAEPGTTVFIVDDDEGVRDSLSLLMESVNQPVKAFASAEEFLHAWDGQPGCVLVLDIRMPEMSGLVLQDRLRELSAVVPIIFITGYGDVSTAVRAMQNGAFDFIQKPLRSQDLLEKVQRALAASGRALEVHDRKLREMERVARLTNREREILEMMVAGKPNKVMAFDLALSQRTVEVHRASVMKKLGVDSLAAAVRVFLVASGEHWPPGRSRSGGSRAAPAPERGAYGGDHREAV